MTKTDTALENAKQARFRYEHAITEARHKRDMAISAAWATYTEKSGSEWATYQEAMAPVEAAMQLDLET